MFALLLKFLPCFISFGYCLLFSTRIRSKADMLMHAMSGCAMFYFFAEINYISKQEDYHTWIMADMLSQYARPMAVPLTFMYLLALVNKPIKRWMWLVPFAIALVVGTISMVIYLTIGIDAAADYLQMKDVLKDIPGIYSDRIFLLHEWFCVGLYQVVILVYAGLSFVFIGWLVRITRFRWSELGKFLFRGGDIEPIYVQCVLLGLVFVSIFVKLGLGRYYFLEHQSLACGFCVARAVLMYCIGHVGLYHGRATVNMGMLRGEEKDVPFTMYDVPFEPEGDASGTVAEGGSVGTPEADASGTVAERIDMARFVEERWYLKQVTIDDVAHMIGSNRTTLSQFINREYGCTFREYVNGLRIEYAKGYYRAHPNVKQEVLAEECGFADAPSFNKKFKSVVGVTPRMWLARES